MKEAQRMVKAFLAGVAVMVIGAVLVGSGQNDDYFFEEDGGEENAPV